MSSAPSSGSISLWEQLLKAVLLGSERASVPTGTHNDVQLASLLAQVKQESREAALLRTAALVGSYERAGVSAESAGEPSLPACVADEAPRCGPGAAAYLRRILGGQFLFLLPEFLSALQAAGKRVPEELLPELLSTTKRSGADLALDVIGHRGQWLVQLNPEWSFLGTTISPEDWETGTRANRVALLRRLRKSTPEKAIALLESTWNSETPEDRSAFVAELEQALSPGDESFLEKALDDRRKEVRQKAAVLLMGLRQSALVERMWERVKPLIRAQSSSLLKLKKLLANPSLQIDLPQVCDDAMQRDGVELKPPQGIGEKAWWLQQMVRAIPPERWERHLQLSPEKVVAAFDASEFNRVLLSALGEAVRRHKSNLWAAPLLEKAIERIKESGAVPAPGAPWSELLESVAAMDESQRDAFVMQHLNRHAEGVNSGVALRLLLFCPGPWSKALGKSVLNLLRYIVQRITEAEGPPFWMPIDDPHNLGSRLPITLADEAQEGWPENAEQKGFFEAIRTIIDVLQFRNKMHKEINR